MIDDDEIARLESLALRTNHSAGGAWRGHSLRPVLADLMDLPDAQWMAAMSPSVFLAILERLRTAEAPPSAD